MQRYRILCDAAEQAFDLMSDVRLPLVHGQLKRRPVMAGIAAGKWCAAARCASGWPVTPIQGCWRLIGRHRRVLGE